MAMDGKIPLVMVDYQYSKEIKYDQFNDKTPP